MARYDSILGTVGDTPVVRINRLAPAGVNLFVKVEAFNPGTSAGDQGELTVTINQSSGEVTAEVTGS